MEPENITLGERNWSRRPQSYDPRTGMSKCPEQASLQKQKADAWQPGAGEEGTGSHCRGAWGFSAC